MSSIFDNMSSGDTENLQQLLGGLLFYFVFMFVQHTW